MKIDGRRKWKNAATEEDRGKYKQLHNDLMQETDKTRGEWLGKMKIWKS